MSRFCASLLCVVLLVGAARAEDAFTVHADRAIALYGQQLYEEAIVEFQAAYAIRQWPRLLFNIGQAHLKLGHAQKALSFYEHYLRLRPEAEPAIKGELERSMEQARALLSAKEPPQEQAAPAQDKGTTPLAAAPKQVVAPLKLPPPRAPERPLYKRWWLWTGVAVLAGAATTAAVLATQQPWDSAAWKAVPDDLRRSVTF